MVLPTLLKSTKKTAVNTNKRYTLRRWKPHLQATYVQVPQENRQKKDKIVREDSGCKNWGARHYAGYFIVCARKITVIGQRGEQRQRRRRIASQKNKRK